MNAMAAGANVSRREFLQMAAAAGVLASVGASPVPAPATSGMPVRTLGKTGERVSAIGLGGYHIGINPDESESISLIRRAIDEGISFLDNSWDYHDGRSEERMGKALRDGYRERVFLMSKIDGRTKASAAEQIDESLRRLQVDHVDLMQFHEVIRMEDPDQILGPGGAMEAMQAAQQAGKVRFIGFTGHKDPAVHLRMLELAKTHAIRFDTVQMPLNVMDAHFRSFEHNVLPVLLKEEIGVLGMKCMGGGAILNSKAVTAVECLRYALSLQVSTLITGIDSPEILDQALETARNFQPMSTDERTALLKRTELPSQEGKFEWFKTSARHDSTARNPEWLGDHAKA